MCSSCLGVALLVLSPTEPSKWQKQTDQEANDKSKIHPQLDYVWYLILM